jgi:hypothetical protein
MPKIQEDYQGNTKEYTKHNEEKETLLRHPVISFNHCLSLLDSRPAMMLGIRDTEK